MFRADMNSITPVQKSAEGASWLEPSHSIEWHHYLKQMPSEKQDIYYYPEYAQLYTTEGAQARCFVFKRGLDLFMCPLLIREIPQLTGYFDAITPYGYGGPLSNSQNSPFLKEAWESLLQKVASKKVIAQLIKFHPLLSNHLLVQPMQSVRLFPVCSTVAVDVNLDEDYRWMKSYSHANRKNINKAKKNNLTIQFGQEDFLWRAFETLYEQTMRANQASSFYYFDKEYFEQIRNCLSKNYILIAALFDQTPVSVLLVLYSEQYAHCHLMGTKPEVKHLGVNNLLHHEAIQWCKTNRISKFHLGGGRSNDEEDSLLRFKLNFSNLKSTFYIAELVLDEARYQNLCQNWEDKNSGEIKSDRLFKYRS
jgi:lipid II:glycine glycyltransferase (peptidoglycan interpeptide bridge formation enzyme)